MTNPTMPRAGKDSTRGLRAHTCFNSCADFGDCLSGFDFDNRPTCRSQNGAQQGILCVDPLLETCENYVEPGMICFDSGNQVCIDWRKIIYAIILANALQLVFETSMLIALKVSLKPTALDKLQELEDEEEEQADQSGNDKAKELDCGTVMNKCCAEIIFILMYVVVLGYFVIGIIYQTTYGNINAVLVEVAIALVVDQLKSVLT